MRSQHGRVLGGRLPATAVASRRPAARPASPRIDAAVVEGDPDRLRLGQAGEREQGAGHELRQPPHARLLGAACSSACTSVSTRIGLVM